MLQLEPGTIFARDFKVLRALAQGGMGAVYEVEQLSTSKTRALKLLHAQLAGDPKIRQRFEQEARVGGRIESDHVVDVVAAGIEEPGTPWLVMEFLKGTDLGEHLEKNGPRPPAEVLEIFRQMGHALAAAHRAGLVHRDLKPENVFLAESRREGAPFTVKVLDFGIAKAIESAPGRATQAMGTPYWMAPEQCEDSKLIAPATDVWAMGLIAYSLLTGACYWRNAQQSEPSIAGLIIEMTTLPLDPPSARAREYHRDHLLPPGFDAWFARCVVRPIDQRYADAAECVAALVPVLTPTASVAPAAPVAQTIAPAQAAAFNPPAGSAPPTAGPTMSAPPMAGPPMSGPPMSAPPMSAPPMSAPRMSHPPTGSVAAPQSYPVTSAPAQAIPFQAPWPVAQPASVVIAAPTSRPPWLIIGGVIFLVAVCVGGVLAWRVTNRRPPVLMDQYTTAPQMIPLPVGPSAPPIDGVPRMTPIEPGVTPPPQPLGQNPPARRPNGMSVVLRSVVSILDTPGSEEAAATVRRALEPHSGQVRACVYSTLAREGGDLHNQLVLMVTVAGGGAITAVVLQEVDSPTLEQCVGRELRRSPFPRGVGGTYKATYSVR